jgi:hypothetical protein
VIFNSVLEEIAASIFRGGEFSALKMEMQVPLKLSEIIYLSEAAGYSKHC